MIFFRPQQNNFPSTGCQESIEWDFYKYQFVLEIMNLNHNLTLRIFSNLLFLPVLYHIVSMKIHMACRFVKKYSPQRLDSEWKYLMDVGTHIIHDDVIKWEHFLHYWPFVRGIHRSPVNSPHKGQWSRALMFSLICAWTNDWVYICEAGDLRRHCAYYAIIVMNLSWLMWIMIIATACYRIQLLGT